MEQNSFDKTLKKNTIISTISLFFQSGYSSALAFVAHSALTILLSPAIFGTYFLVVSFLSVFNYFSDIGLAASLVQKKEISDDDVKTAFTIQQILIITLIIIGFSITPFVTAIYKQLSGPATYLYWALLISFFISSLKTIPSIFLERAIKFQKIVIVQVVEQTVFYGVVVTLAFLQFGIMSFTYAVIARAIVGLVLMYYISPWMPKIGIVRKNAKQLISFGAMMQMSSLLALVKDDFINLYLGLILNTTQLGYIAWAKKYAEAFLRIIMDSMSRILFPIFSRIQHDNDKIKRLLEKTLTYQTLLLAPTLIGSVVLMPYVVSLSETYSVKWGPALPLFFLLSLSAFFSSYSSPFTNMFNALGKINITFSLMLYWTTATWLLTPPLTYYFGELGYPLTQVLLSLSFVYVIKKAQKLIDFSVIKHVYPSILSALVMGGLMWTMLTILPRSTPSLIVAGIIGMISYPLFLRFLFKVNIITEVKSLMTYGK